MQFITQNYFLNIPFSTHWSFIKQFEQSQFVLGFISEDLKTLRILREPHEPIVVPTSCPGGGHKAWNLIGATFSNLLPVQNNKNVLPCAMENWDMWLDTSHFQLRAYLKEGMEAELDGGRIWKLPSYLATIPLLFWQINGVIWAKIRFSPSLPSPPGRWYSYDTKAISNL